MAEMGSLILSPPTLYPIPAHLPVLIYGAAIYILSGENQAISLDSFILLLSHMMRTPICLNFTFFHINRNSSWAPVQNEDYISQLLLQLTVDLWLSFGQLDVNRSVKQPLFISLSFFSVLMFWIVVLPWTTRMRVAPYDALTVSCTCIIHCPIWRQNLNRQCVI